MSDPITIGALTTLVGLIATYKQLKDGRESGEVQDFQSWLAQHRFTQLSDQIARSYDLQVSLGELLREDNKALFAKLEVIEDVVRSVASKLEGFQILSHSLDHDGYLSDQACKFIDRFNSIGCSRVICNMDDYGMEIAFLPVGIGAFEPSEPRFFADDLDCLRAAGWISLDGMMHGQPVYRITRKGAGAAELLIKRTQ